MGNRGTSRTKGESGKNQISEGRGEQVTTDSVALGDVIFIKLRRGSWWPAQVVDENCVNKSIKPRKRSAGEVLVRLYGSYTYMYADPIKCRSEFETILENNSGSYRKILQEALEQDLPSTKSSRAKGSASKTKDKKSNQTHSDSQHSTKSEGSQRKRQRNSPRKEAKGKEAKGKTSVGNKMLKNLEANDSKADGQARASDQNGTSCKTKLKRNANDIEKKGRKSSGQDKARSLSPGTEKKMKRKQDKTRENVKQRVLSAEKEVKRKSSKQDEEQKDLVLDKKPQRSKPIEVQNKVKRQKPNEILNDDDLSRQSPEINSFGKSQELSARRLRVMKSLGLIAPPGSPFHKGHIYNGS